MSHDSEHQPASRLQLLLLQDGWDQRSARWWTEITRVTGGPDTYAMVVQTTFFGISLSFDNFALNIWDKICYFALNFGLKNYFSRFHAIQGWKIILLAESPVITLHYTLSAVRIGSSSSSYNGARKQPQFNECKNVVKIL